MVKRQTRILPGVYFVRESVSVHYSNRTSDALRHTSVMLFIHWKQFHFTNILFQNHVKVSRNFLNTTCQKIHRNTPPRTSVKQRHK